MGKKETLLEFTKEALRHLDNTTKDLTEEQLDWKSCARLRMNPSEETRIGLDGVEKLILELPARISYQFQIMLFLRIFQLPYIQDLL